MPRVSFIPSTIDFNDRGMQIANPILQNAMQLAETYATDIPRIRMQQEAAEEEKNRYARKEQTDQERYNTNLKMQQDNIAHTRAREADADTMARFGGAGSPVSRLRMPTSNLSAPGRPAATGAIEQKDRALESRERLAQQQARINYVKDRVGQNLGDKMNPKYLTAEEAAAEFDRLNPAPEPDHSGTYMESPLGRPDAAMDGGEEATGGRLYMGAEQDDSQVMAELQRLDNLRMNVPAEQRARLGLLSDEQIEQRKMLLMGDQYPGAAGAAPAEAPPVPEAELPPLDMGGAGVRLTPEQQLLQPPEAPPAAPAQGPPPEHVQASLSKVAEVVQNLRAAISANIDVRKNLGLLMQISAKVPMEHRAAVGLDAPMNVPNQGVGELRDTRRDPPVVPGPAEDDAYWETPQGRRALQVRMTMPQQASSLPRDYNW